MSRHWVSLVAVLVSPFVAWAGEIPGAPTTHPPKVSLATAVEKDGVTQLRILVPGLVPYTVMRNVPATENSKDGRKTRTVYKTVTETFYKPVMVESRLIADGKKVQVLRKNGKAINPKDLPKLLGKQTAVLFFSDGEVDPYYLQVLHDQVLIITVPRGSAPRGQATGEERTAKETPRTLGEKLSRALLFWLDGLE
jgi:hypothetical protein